MATSTLRAVILVALVVLGILGLTKLFPENASLGLTAGSSPSASISSPTSSPSSGVSPTPTATRKPQVRGVVVLVLNGSGQTGAAAGVSDVLKAKGYKMKTPKNAPHRVRTTIFYRADSQPEALDIQAKYFPNAIVKPANASVPDDVQIEIVLGTDFVPIT